MLKKIYLPLALALIFSSTVKAEETSTSETEAEVPVEAEAVTQEIAEPAESPDLASPEAPSAEAEGTVSELSEAELTEMVGYLTAQGGAVPILQLDEGEIAILTEGLVASLQGESIDNFSQESLQEAFETWQARAEAIEKKTEKIPEIGEESLLRMGFIMAMQSGLLQLEFGPEDADSIRKGFIAGANGMDDNPIEKAQLPAFQEFIQKRVAAARAKALAEAESLAAERIAAGKAFLEELIAADTDIQKSESGLHYKVIEPGAEPKPTLEDSVLVHYKGTLIDGAQFDSSYDRGQPAEFPLNGVVPGFGEGLTKIGAGGKITLYIPSDLGYGNSPRPGGLIQPGDTLIFECELLEVNP